MRKSARLEVMQYESFDSLREAGGLRLVCVSQVPSPWSQSARAMLDYKRLPYRLAAFEPLRDNPEITAWAGTCSAPVLAWNDEAPVNRWNDILLLLERLAPARPLLPATYEERVQAFGIAQEICGELGFGWNRRLCQLQPLHDSGTVPPPLKRFGQKYGYGREEEVSCARQRVVGFLHYLGGVLERQEANGRRFLVSADVTAVDFYWAAFSLLIKARPLADVPIAAPFQPLFLAEDKAFLAAMSPALEAHRDRMLENYFNLPLLL